tara:strand:- start:175 stop:546 length:372 start_codon:yes stop_codon:yes gene_type:complete
MPEHVDKKTGKRLYHENETTLNIEKTVLGKFEPKTGKGPSSYMHRDSIDEDSMDVDRTLDDDGKLVLQPKSKLSLYDVEYKLEGMVVVPVDKNTGKVLDEKQIKDLRKQLMKNWNFVDEDEEE